MAKATKRKPKAIMRDLVEGLGEHLELREKWLNGNLDYRLEPQQLELIAGMRDPNVTLVYGDFTRRGGKTDCAGTYCIEECLKGKQDIRYATAFQTDLVELIKPAFDTIFEDCPEDLKPQYKESRRAYYFGKHKSRIKLVGLDLKPNGIRGNAVTIIVIDEAAFVANLEYIYKNVIMPATARRKKQMQRKIKFIIISSPPPNAEEHFTFKLRTKAQTEPGGFYLCKTLDEIDSIPAEEKERLLQEAGGRDSVTAQREYFCKWIVDAEQAICAQFNKQLHVQAFELPPHVVPGFAGDSGGVQDKTVGLVGAYDIEKELYLVRSEASHDPNVPSDTIIKSFKELVGNRKMNQFLDAPGQILIDYANYKDEEGKPAPFAAALPPKDDFHAGLKMLRSLMFQNKILIHPDCVLLIKTLAGGLLNRSKTDFARTKELGHADAAAALIYLIRVVDKQSDNRPKPSPRTHQVYTKPNPIAKAFGI